jgi:hypothetical protein
MATYPPQVTVRINANFDGSRFRGINYEPGFAVVSPGDEVKFETDLKDVETAVLIVFPRGTPFAAVQPSNTTYDNGSLVRFIVRPNQPIVRTVRIDAEKRAYKYAVAVKRSDDALLDGGCPEIFVDM